MTDTMLDRDRADLLDALGERRGFLRHTVAGLTDEQAAATPTASELCLGGLIKHVAITESHWVDFIEQGTAAMAQHDDSYADHADSFRMLSGESLEGVLAGYAAVAARTDALVATLPDLDAAHALPPAPWFDEEVEWTARRVFLHILGETAQHAGHADLLRETIDGQKTMG